MATFEEVKQAALSIRDLTPNFSAEYDQFIAMWPAVSASGDQALINEWMSIKTDADQFMYLIKRVGAFFDSAGTAIRAAFGLAGLSDSTILQSMQSYIGQAALASIIGAPAYMYKTMQQINDFLATAPDRMYQALMAAGMSQTEAVDTVQKYITATNQPSLSSNVVQMIQWAAVFAAIVIIAPKLLKGNKHAA